MSESPAAPKLYDSAKEIVVSVFPSSATLSAIVRTHGPSKNGGSEGEKKEKRKTLDLCCH